MRQLHPSGPGGQQTSRETKNEPDERVGKSFSGGQQHLKKNPAAERGVLIAKPRTQKNCKRTAHSKTMSGRQKAEDKTTANPNPDLIHYLFLSASRKRVGDDKKTAEHHRRTRDHGIDNT